MTDEEITRQWSLAMRLWKNRNGYSTRSPCAGPSLSERIAIRIADRMDAAGVTEADIHRLFHP